jgi:hypothetical protein
MVLHGRWSPPTGPGRDGDLVKGDHEQVRLPDASSMAAQRAARRRRGGTPAAGAALPPG